MDLDFRKIVSRHLMCEVKTDINDFDNCEMQCYSESTADGYDVYILKYTQDALSVCENVYYYDHDIAEQIMYSLDENKVDSIYIDEHLYDECYIEDALEEYFNEHVDDILNDSPELFSDEEKSFIREEYDVEI